MNALQPTLFLEGFAPWRVFKTYRLKKWALAKALFYLTVRLCDQILQATFKSFMRTDRLIATLTVAATFLGFAPKRKASYYSRITEPECQRLLVYFQT